MPTTKEEKLDGWLSVTEVLDTFIPKGLLDWFLKTGAKEAKRLSTIAMKIGSRVDELIQEDVVNKAYKFSSKDSIEIKNCMEAWESFKKDFGLDVKAVQVEVRDEAEKIVGHIDIIGWGKLIDVKCASSIKPVYWIQTSKYAKMLFHKTYLEDGELLEPAILRLDKNLATYQFVTASQAKIVPSDCVKIFDGLLMAYRLYNRPKV